MSKESAIQKESVVREDKVSKESVVQKELIQQELKALINEKEVLLGQINQLEQALRTGETNLRRAVEEHNKIQAQIEILQKLLQDPKPKKDPPA